MRFLRTGLAASLACIALVAASVTRVHLEVLDRRSLPAERVQIELHECLRGTVPGNSDEQGELRFTAFRWCPSYEIILKNYGGSHERVFQLASSDFLLSSEIGCTIFDGRSIRCR